MAGDWYTRKQFLFTFRFMDEPSYIPNLFLRDEDTFTQLCVDVAKNISRGMRVEKAFNACGIRTRTYEEWRSRYREELDAGKHDTPLIRLFDAVNKADAELDLSLHDLAMDRVLEGDEKMLHFLMKHRLGYNTQRTELELSNQGDTPFTVNIVGMTDVSAPSKEHPKPVERDDEGEEKHQLIDENGVVYSE